jgi:hypothetical protein
MFASRNSAKSALRVVLFSAVIGWSFFLLANYADYVLEATLSPEELFGSEAFGLIRPSKYLIFAAITAFALGSLLAMKKLQRLRSNADSSQLAAPALKFATTAVIISLVVSAWAAIGVFLESFFDGSGGVDISTRVLNSYLPIVLYTGLAITVLLAAFVFNRHGTPEAKTKTEPTNRTKAAPHQTEPAQINARVGQGHPDPHPEASAPLGNSSAQRALALAYTVPIVAVAVALIFGLIVYDLTQTALEVWIWVLIQSFIAAGIIVGVFFASQSMRTTEGPGTQPPGVNVGAKNLNFVLSIIFSAILALMSLGYGVSAIEQLRVQPSISISAYPDQTVSIDSADSAELDDPKTIIVMANGFDLQRSSAAEVLLEPGAVRVLSAEADRDGFLSAEADFPSGIDAGDYSLTLRAMNVDGTDLTIAIDAIVGADGNVSFPEGNDAYSAAVAATMIPVSLGWVVSDLLPALLLLLLAATAMYVTLTVRNRD